MGEPSDSMARSESSFGGFQNSNNSSGGGNWDFWFGMFKDPNSNQNDFSFNAETPRPSSRDNQWGHVFEQRHPPKKKSNKHKKKKKRKMNLYMGSNCSAVNSTSDVSEALSEALSAISANLSLSSSSSSSHTSSQKSHQDMDPNKREMSIEEKHKLGVALLSLPQFDPVLEIIKKRNKDIGLEGGEIVIDVFFWYITKWLDMETLWELQFFVTNYQKMAGKPKRQDMSTAANDSNEMLYPVGAHSLPLESDDSPASDSVRDEMRAGAESQKVNLSVPDIGKEFASEEEAYNFYKRYANRVGFNVRKGKVQRSSSGDIQKRYFFCSREGFRSKKHSNNKKKYKRKETRTGCSARMECMVKNGKWVTSQFFEKHNHDLEDRMNTESQTRTSEAHLMIHSNDEAEMEKVPETTKVVKSCSMGCFSNERDKKAISMQPEDAQNLMDHLRHRQAEDPSFFHAIQLDDNCRLKNIFWSDGMSKIDYAYFGDVLILDTSFKVYKHGHNMICAPFLGINHHRQFVLFGCALLLDNSTDSFIWLFETFMEAMGRRQPKSLFTDESEAIGDAVKLVMPEAHHQIGMWYISQNASKHLSAYFELPGFKRLLNECISDCETEEEFESRWSALLTQFNLHGNEWLGNLHASRDRWSPLFSQKTFSAGIQHHASIESIFQNLARDGSTASFSTFVEQYLRAAKQQRSEELHEDFRCNDTELNMTLASCPAGLAEKQAASVYTCTMFKVFQKQLPTLFLVTMNEVANDGTIATFKLTEVGKKKEFFVEFNCLDSSVACSCKKYECEGILCVHALKVLNSRDIYEIPAQYILKRWTKSAKDGVLADDHGNNKLFYKALNVIAKIAAVEENEKIAVHYLDRAREEIEKLLETKRSKCVFSF